MIRLEIPDIPPSLNEWTRMHWTKQHQVKIEWAWTVLACAMTAKTGKPHFKMATVKITYYFTKKRRRDTDNYAPKFLLDALVQAGIIQDDRDDWVKVSWDFASGPTKKTIIEIREGWPDESTGPAK